MQETQNPHQDLLLKAAQDQDFREALIANPKETIAEFLGTDLPADLSVRVVENTPTELTLVLPPMLGDELDDDALDSVTGGSIMDDRRRSKDRIWSMVSLGIACLVSIGTTGQVRCIELSSR